MAKWRERLTDIGWFMGRVNESVARQSNREEGCKGRFWEGRFKSQALLDQAAILTCMVYVDLNPVRAGIAEKPEDSDYTSIQERIFSYAKRSSKKNILNKQQVKHIKQQLDWSSAKVQQQLLPDIPFAKLYPLLSKQTSNGTERAIAFSRQDYFDLLDWTGREVRGDGKASINKSVPPILQRLGIDEEKWLKNVNLFGSRFHNYVGPVERLKACAQRLNQAWVQGLRACQGLYGESLIVGQAK